MEDTLNKNWLLNQHWAFFNTQNMDVHEICRTLCMTSIPFLLKPVGLLRPLMITIKITILACTPRHGNFLFVLCAHYSFVICCFKYLSSSNVDSLGLVVNGFIIHQLKKKNCSGINSNNIAFCCQYYYISGLNF